MILPPATEPVTVQGWLHDHAAANRDTPALHGRSIREVIPFAPRNAALNVVPPAGPLVFGPATRAVTAPRELLAPLWTDGRPVVPATAGFWINFFLDQPGRVELSITYDREVLPEPRILADAIRAVIETAAHQPETGLGPLRVQLRD